MIDFLQNNEVDKGNKLSKVPRAKKQARIDKPSWLRGLLHPVSGKVDSKNPSIDLLAVAKTQVQPTGSKVRTINKKKVSKEPKFKNEASSENKELSTKGSKAIAAKEKKGFDVNLLPATVRFQSTNKITVSLFLWAFMAVGILVVVYLGMSFYGQQITDEGLALEAELDFLNTEIAKYNSDVVEAIEWQLKLSAVDILLKTHVYWTNFFSVLEKTTLPSVYYNGFTASLINSDINLVSYAKNFTTVAEQLIAYEKFPEIFSSFSVAEASLDEGIGINYNALVNLKRSLFYDNSFLKSCE
jgi:hypothetical protein